MKKPKSCRWQFSLMTMLLLMTIFAVYFWYLEYRVRERLIGAEFFRRGTYQYDLHDVGLFGPLEQLTVDDAITDRSSIGFISLSDQLVDRQLVRALSCFTNLEVIALHNCKLTKDCLHWLVGQKSMRRIQLSFCDLTELPLGELSRHSGLKYLLLDNCRFNAKFSLDRQRILNAGIKIFFWDSSLPYT